LHIFFIPDGLEQRFFSAIVPQLAEPSPEFNALPPWPFSQDFFNCGVNFVAPSF